MWRRPVSCRPPLVQDAVPPWDCHGNEQPGDPMKITRRTVLSAAAATIAAAALPARAAGYPDKPVKIVVGFAAGGGADIIARMVGTQMGIQTGQSFIVDNKAGATGTIAAAYVAKSQPDGYTIFLG